MKGRFLLPPANLDRKRYLRTAIIRSTLISILISMTITLLIEYFTPNPDYLWGLIIAGLVPLLVVPPLTVRHHMLLFELEQSKQKIQELSRTDDLTQPADRRYFFSQAEHHLCLAERHHQPLSILMIDLDHFKDVNDQFGHQVGDQVLKNTAKIMAKSIRTTDILVHYGGEEFVLLMPQTAEENAFETSQRLRENLVREQAASTSLPAVTMSIGVTSTERIGHALRELLMQADRAMYLAKSRGRDNCVVAGRLKSVQ